ncbi:MAG: CBS domain-containing protein [Planctomycetota bacterium]
MAELSLAVAIPRAPVTLVPEVPAMEALQLMDHHRVTCLPVCTLMGILLGMVHREDLLPYVNTDTVVGLLRRS